MSSVCLSLVTTLRCAGLQPSQNIAILVPPFAEAIFGSTLIYTQYGYERKHWLLVTEGWLYLLLCILDFASKSNNSIATSLSSFPKMDRAIGALSGLPVLLFTTFLFVFMRRNLLIGLPSHYHWVTKACLICLIPIIFILTELGSLLGIGYVMIPSPLVLPPPGVPLPPNPFSNSLIPQPLLEVAIKFDSENSKTLWTFLNSASLAFLVVYQGINSLLGANRVFGQIRGGRKAPNDVGGIGWIALGTFIGTVDSLLGFVPGSFGADLTRRLMRMFGRCMIVYGVAKSITEESRTAKAGLYRVGSIDSIEGLPPRRVPVTDLRERIGRPLTGSFAKLSPTASGFYLGNKPPQYSVGAIPNYESVDEKKPLPPPMTVRNATTPSSIQTAYPSPAARRRAAERVTVAYDGSAPPNLELRFSELPFSNPDNMLKKLEEAKQYRPSPLSNNVDPRSKTKSPEITETQVGQTIINPDSPRPFSNYVPPPGAVGSRDNTSDENPFADPNDVERPVSRMDNYDRTPTIKFSPFEGGAPLRRSRTLPDDVLPSRAITSPPISYSPPRSSSIRSTTRRKVVPSVSPRVGEIFTQPSPRAAVETEDMVAERARRRLRTHFAQMATADDGYQAVVKTTDGVFPPPFVMARKKGASAPSDSFLPGGDDSDSNGSSPSPVYNNTFKDRPVGRLAKRALGIERALDEDKARRNGGNVGTSSIVVRDSSNDTSPTQSLVIPDSATVGKRSARDTPRSTPATTPRKPWMEDDEEAREAFAAAWRTVAPTPSPTIAALRYVNSVTARKTPTLATTPTATNAESGVVMDGIMAEDREFLRKSRLIKRASMDSDIY